MSEEADTKILSAVLALDDGQVKNLEILKDSFEGLGKNLNVGFEIQSSKIENMLSSNESLQTSITDFYKYLKNRDQEVEELREKIDELLEKIEIHKIEEERLTEDVDRVMIDNMNHYEAFMQYKSQYDELSEEYKSQSDEIIAIFNSTSWKITRPLRLITNQMKKLIIKLRKIRPGPPDGVMTAEGIVKKYNG